MSPLPAPQTPPRTVLFRISIAIAFGITGFLSNFLDIQLLDTAGLKINILIGLFFPLTIALAWGWRYGLLSALAGGCQSMWWLWHGDGWGFIYAVPVFTLWIVWHGWWAGVREKSGGRYPWYQSVFVVEIPFRVVSELGFLTIFTWLVSLNPPPWAPDITWNGVSLAWVRTVAIKHTVTGYILLLASYVVLNIAPVRNMLGLRKKSAQNEVSILYAGSILVGLTLWMADAVLHFWLDNGELAAFWDIALFNPGPHLFMRIAFMFLALCGAAALSPMLRSRGRLRDRAMHLNDVLEGLHGVNKVIDRVKDPHELIGSACDQLLRSKGYLSACILQLDAKGEYVDHGAANIHASDAQVREHFQNNPLCPSMVQALERQDLVVTRKHMDNCDDCPCHGDQGAMDPSPGCFTCPITYRDRVYGVLTATLLPDRMDDTQEQYLFKEIGADIAFALHGLEEEAKRRRAETALRESEQRFSQLLESVPEVAVQGYGPDGTVHYWNQASETIYGYTQEEALGSNLVDLIIPEYMQEKAREVIARGARDAQMPPPQELTLKNKHGEPITVLSSHAVVFRAGRDPELYCIDIDLRQRKLAESELMASRAEIQSIFRSAPVGIGLTKNRTIVRANKRLYGMLGYTEEELVGRSTRMLYPSQEDFDRFGPEVYALIKDSGMGTVETRLIHKNGSVLHVILSFTPLDLDDYSKGITFSALDISARKRAEDALRQSQEYLRTILHSIGDAVIATDDQARVTTMNPAAESLTGWDRQEANGLPLRTVFSIVGATDREECENPAAKAMDQGKIVGLANNTVLIAKDGSEYQVADSAAPIRDISGQITGAVLVFRDVTQEYRMRKELQKMDKLESLGNLAGGLAHDFNNILMGIYGNIELASTHLDQEHPAREFLGNAEQSMDRATRITNKLLTFSKGGNPVKQRLSVAGLIRDTVTFDLSGSGVESSFETEEGLWIVEADKIQLEQVFSNLTINAKQAMDGQGSLYVTMGNEGVGEDDVAGIPAGTYVKIVFQDTGPGIAPGHIDSVFDPYFTTHQTGSGLGLATVYSIVSKHGGGIVVQSEPGHGAKFSIYLPAVEEPDRHATPPGPAKNIQVREQSDKRTQHILIMDDETMIQEVLTALLKSMGYRVTVTSDGRQALEVYHKAMDAGAPFDAVILDLTIPGGMGGAKTMQELLKIDPNARGIVSSGYADDPIIARFQDYGFRGVAIKPYTLQELRNTLETVLG
ncbi:hybrid sensor histidine kinase/response regulator [Desulfoplanes sp.]